MFEVICKYGDVVCDIFAVSKGIIITAYFVFYVTIGGFN